jgi:hypothetical protein
MENENTANWLDEALVAGQAFALDDFLMFANAVACWENHEKNTAGPAIASLT